MPLITDKTTIGDFDLYLWTNWLPNADSRIRSFNCLVLPALEPSRHLHLQICNLAKLLTEARGSWEHSTVSFSNSTIRLSHSDYYQDWKSSRGREGSGVSNWGNASSGEGKIKTLPHMKGKVPKWSMWEPEAIYSLVLGCPK